MSFRALRLSDQFDPIVLRGTPLHHLVRAVGRSVADDDPFSWSDRLPHHGLDGQFNERCLVPRRGDENVGRKCQHPYIRDTKSSTGLRDQ